MTYTRRIKQYVCFKEYTTPKLRKGIMKITVLPYKGIKPDGFYHEIIPAYTKIEAREEYRKILETPKQITKPNVKCQEQSSNSISPVKN